MTTAYPPSPHRHLPAYPPAPLPPLPPPPHTPHCCHLGLKPPKKRLDYNPAVSTRQHMEVIITCVSALPFALLARIC